MEQPQVNYSEFVTSLVKPGRDILKSLDDVKVELWHYGMALPIEACEVAELAFDEGYPKIEELIEELGDIEFFLEAIRLILNIERPLRGYADKSKGMSFRYLVLKLCKHCGLIGDYIKKFVVYEKQLMIPNIITSLGDVEESLADIRNCFILTREQIVQANYEKLSKRYHKGKYSNEQAQERADKQ